ncbi:MAG TPA: hypothetical protein VM890_12060 [Longimicrobium sp.]|nr:hypothetical protein [Longimicrobium sp.]
MTSLKLNLDALQVQSFATVAEARAAAQAPAMVATANTCYRTCYATHCFC